MTGTFRAITAALALILMLSTTMVASSQVTPDHIDSCIDAITPTHCQTAGYASDADGTMRGIFVMEAIFEDASAPALIMSDVGFVMLIQEFSSEATGQIIEVTDDFEDTIDAGFGVNYRAMMFDSATGTGTPVETIILIVVTPDYVYTFFTFNPDTEDVAAYVSTIINGGNIADAPQGYEPISGDPEQYEEELFL